MMMHLEIKVDDLRAAVAQAVALGATLAAFQPQEDVRDLLSLTRTDGPTENPRLRRRTAGTARGCHSTSLTPRDRQRLVRDACEFQPDPPPSLPAFPLRQVLRPRPVVEDAERPRRAQAAAADATRRSKPAAAKPGPSAAAAFR